MADLAFTPQHNMVAYLEKTKSNAKFHQIVDFLISSSIHHALTVLELENVKTAQAKEIARRHSLGKRKVMVGDKGSGEKGGSTAETVSTARPDISAARPEVSIAELKTPPTITTLFNDKHVTIANTLVKMKSRKPKEKGVTFKDEIEPVKKTKKRDQDQIERDAKFALKIQADLDEEVRTKRERQKEASKAALAGLYDKKLGTMEAGDVHVYKLTRLDGSYRHFSTFSRMLEVLDRQDVLDLYKIVMEGFPANDPEGYDLILRGDLNTLMKSSKDDEIWRN
nr:hypothetical protein [Tanacetum cinerariifolium]